MTPSKAPTPTTDAPLVYVDPALPIPPGKIRLKIAPFYVMTLIIRGRDA